MNTGIQDAYNLAWKLALVERGGLPTSRWWTAIRPERHPVGREVCSGRPTGCSRLSAGRNPLARLGPRAGWAPLLAGRVLNSPVGPPAVRRPAGATAGATIRTAHSAPRTVRAGGTRPHPGDRAREADVMIDGRAGTHARGCSEEPSTPCCCSPVLTTKRSLRWKLCRIAERIEADVSGAGEKARVVTAERFADHPAALGDPTRSAPPSVWGHLGPARSSSAPTSTSATAGRPVEVDRLMADLAKRLVAGASQRRGNASSSDCCVFQPRIACRLVATREVGSPRCPARRRDTR